MLCMVYASSETNRPALRSHCHISEVIERALNLNRYASVDSRALGH